MVAPTVAPSKPTLSYAERAKKAQNIKSPIAAAPPVFARPPQPPPAPASDPSTSSATSSAPISSSATSVDEIHVTRSSSPNLADSFTGPVLSSPDPNLTAKSTTDPATAPPKPQVNVWNQRIEKMVAARASSAAQKPITTTSPTTISPQQRTLAPAAGITPSTSQSSSLKSPTSNGGKKQKNGSPSLERDREDAFTIKVPTHLRTSAPTTPPRLPDPNDWPEVGKSLPTPSTSSSQVNHADGSSPDRTQNGLVTTPKKSERKWIPVPKEELQASVDAAKRASRSQSRARNKTSSSRQSLQPSTSTPNVPSRSHSGHTSAAPSAPHSRVQSRAGSVQSSPKVPRGRRLPPDDAAASSSGAKGTVPKTPDAVSSARVSPLPEVLGNQISAPNSVVNSHRASPASAAAQQPFLGVLPIQASQSQTHTQSQPQPTQTFQSSHTPPHTHLPHRSGAFHPAAPIYYPLPHPSNSHTPHSHTHATGSGSNSPHPLSPSTTMYPNLPMQGAYPGYPMYTPYEMNFPGAGPGPGQYMPWGPSMPVPLRQTMSGNHSPVYPPPPQGMPIPVSPNLLFGMGGQQQQFGGALGDGERRPLGATTRSREDSTSLGVGKEKMVFGSIAVGESGGRQEVQKEDVKGDVKETERDKENATSPLERGFGSLAIGVQNGESIPPRLRTRTKENQKEAGGQASTLASPNMVDPPSQIVASTSTSSVGEVKWRFGTASSTPPPREVDDAAAAGEVEVNVAQGGRLPPSVTMPAFPTSESTSSMVGQDLRGSVSFVMPSKDKDALDVGLVDSGLYQSPPMQASTSASTSPGRAREIGVPSEASVSPDPDLEVKDFGYGFGDASGSGYAPVLVAEKQKGWAHGSGGGSGQQHSVPVSPNANAGLNGEEVGAGEQIDGGVNGVGGRGRDGYHHPRGKRGGYARGMYPGERGGAYGGGGGRRGRGVNGVSNRFGRGGPGGYGGPRGAGPSATSRTISGNGSVLPPPAFGETPPTHFQNLPMDSGAVTPPSMPPPPHGYYMYPQPLHPRHGQYIPSGMEGYGVPHPPPRMGHSTSMGHGDALSPPTPPVLLSAGGLHRPPQPPHLQPPVPEPKTTISFPLDSTRYYLLGQLEYYLSHENLVKDLYLRQNMDERGWIPITLFVSFKRVMQLTMDVQLVRDVLTLSSLVQVRGNMVRMGGWEQFVLPDAQPSTVEEQPLPYPYQSLTPYYDPGMPGMPVVGMEGYGVGYPQTHAGVPGSGPLASPYDGMIKSGVVSGTEDEDEEDDVEFVLGEVDAWSGASPDRRT